MKKKVLVNLSAIPFSVFPFIGQFFIFYIGPIFYGVYNYLFCKDIKDMVKMYAISLFCQLIGLYLAEYIMYILSSDYNDFMETPAILLINIIITLFVDIVLLVLKALKNRCGKKEKCCGE